MPGKVPRKIYAPATQNQVMSDLRRGYMPTAFVRRMRVLNLLSMVVLGKIEEPMLFPFDTMDLHHILDRQISQDAIIDQINNEPLSYALATGNINPLWDVTNRRPKLRDSFTSGWASRFFNRPFDPICVMLAMRVRLVLELIDEQGHSYNLLRFFPAEVFEPILEPEPIPGPPGPPEPEPPTPPWVYVGPIPGPEPGPEPGMTPGGAPAPGSGPGGSWDGWGGGPDGGAPFGPGPGGGALGASGGSSGGSSWAPGDPCADKDDPTETVAMGYTTQQMRVNETQELTVEGYHPKWLPSNYSWEIASGGGTLSAETGYSVIYTAPEENPDCELNPVINLICGEEVMATLAIAINAYFVDIPAVRVWEDPTCWYGGGGEIWNCSLINRTYNCDNELMAGYPCTLSRQAGSCEGCYADTSPAACHSGTATMVELEERSPIDLRGVGELGVGCCPEEML